MKTLVSTVSNYKIFVEDVFINLNTENRKMSSNQSEPQPQENDGQVGFTPLTLFH